MEDIATSPPQEDTAYRHVCTFHVRFGDIDMRAH